MPGKFFDALDIIEIVRSNLDGELEALEGGFDRWA
jgi:hypothetical protein